MIDERTAQRMTLSRRGKRELAWQLRHERGWTLVRIGRRLGINPAAVSRLLQRVASAEQSNVLPPVTPRLPPRWVHTKSLSSAFQV
jgi:hypothetical protein